MSFPLRRLPFLAIREMIKSMDTRQIFLFSLVSKKSQNFVLSSIPKNSLSVEFTFKEDGFRLELMPAGYSRHVDDILLSDSYRFQGEFVPTRVSTNNLYVQSNFYSFSGTPEVEESTRKLFYYFSNTFKKSEISMRFENGTREAFAMEMMRFYWENGIPLYRSNFSLKNVSLESIRELLNECNEQHTSLHIRAKIPEDFKCTPPPGGYKFENLSVDYAHWVNLDDFLQCRNVCFTTGFPDLTPEYLNDLLKKIINMECRFENFIFKLTSIKPTDFPEIVRGLSKRPTELEEESQELEFERKDGLKLQVFLCGEYLVLEDDYF
ncbi:unnamed protein product [Caenorhabditis brenneri]